MVRREEIGGRVDAVPCANRCRDGDVRRGDEGRLQVDDDLSFEQVARGSGEGPREMRGPVLRCVPSMTIDLEVKVLWGVGRNDPSEPQGENRERLAESSGERDLWGDEQKPDMRRGRPGRAGK